MRTLVRAGSSVIVLAAVLSGVSAPARAQTTCSVSAERTSRSLEYVPIPWGGEVDVTPRFVIDCPIGVRASTLSVTEELTDQVEWVAGVGRPPDGVDGHKLSWHFDVRALGPTDPVSFTYRLYMTPDPARFLARPTVEVDWPMRLDLATTGGAEHPPGPEPDPLVVRARPGARACDRSVSRRVFPDSVLPGESFEVEVSLRFDRCLRPGLRQKAMVVVDPPAHAGEVPDLGQAIAALVDAVDQRDPGERGAVGIVINGASAAVTVAPTVDRAAVLAAVASAPSGQTASRDAAAGLQAAVPFLTDWYEHHEVIYVVTHGAAPQADPDVVRRILADAEAAGTEVVPVCIGGSCDPALTYAYEVPDLDQLRNRMALIPRDHWGPPLPVRGLELEERLPTQVVLVPDSASDNATTTDTQLTWSALSVPVGDTLTLRYRAHAATWGRFPVGSPSYLRFESDLVGERKSELLMPGFVTVRRDPTMDDDPCRMVVTKTADPSRIYLGSQVTVTLTARPYCQDLKERMHVVLSLDRSASMGTDKSEFSYVKLAARALAEMLAVDVADDRRFGLVSHGTQPTVDVPLSNDLPTITALIDGVTARGGDNVPRSIAIGAQMLRDARPPGGGGPAEVLVVLTDGGQTVAPALAIPPARAAAADGITVVALCAVSAEAHCDVVRKLASEPSYYFEVRSVHEVLSAFVDLGVQLRQRPLGAATIVDDLPPHVRYEAGSAVPPPDSVEGERLTWHVAQLSPLGRQIAYRALPMLVGSQATNVWAHIDFEDTLGQLRRQVFPVPTVKTYVDQTPDACDARIRHLASPQAVGVGDVVTLTMTVRTECPSLRQPLDVVLAIDKSESMRQYDRMENAKLAVGAFLDSLDPSTTRVGLVVFERHVVDSVALTYDFDAVRTAVNGLWPRGTTDIEPALDEAARLIGDGDDTRHGVALVVLLTDGMTIGSVEGMQRAAGRIADDGILLATVCAGTCDPVLPTLASRPDMAFQVAESSVLVELFRSLKRSIQRPFPHDIAVHEQLSPLVEPIAGSFVPPLSALDAAAGRLEWRTPDMATEAMTITYAVRPMAPGRIPVGIADMSYVYGNSPSRLLLQAPVPVIDVTSDVSATPLPPIVPTATPTLRPTSTPAATTANAVLLPSVARGYRQLARGDDGR